MQYTSFSSINRRQLLITATKAAGLGAAASLLPIKNIFGQDAKKMPFQFKYAMCNEMYGDMPFEKAFAMVAEAGYKALEMAPFTMANFVTDISAKRRAEVRKQAEQAGLEILGLHWLLAKTTGFHLTTDDAAVRRKTAEYFGELARFCADLGGTIMVLGSPKQRDLAPGMSKEQGMKNAAEVLRAAVPVFEKTKVTVALEPLSTAETNFMTTAAEGVELMNLVDSPHVRLHLDCKAMSSEPTPIPELIHKYHKVAVHFHANDANRLGPGFGKLDFVPIFKALREVDYRGWVSVEALDYTPGVERLTRESIAYMKKCAAESEGK
jgi:sugar phosphate isomerase/epimerase